MYKYRRRKNNIRVRGQTREEFQGSRTRREEGEEERRKWRNGV